MSGFSFARATQHQARLRLALIGPPGSGKTYSALSIAQHLGQRVALIDTERGSASKYANLFAFDTLQLELFSPANYVAAIQAADQAGYDVLIIDSLSHAWMGKGGALEMVDQAAKRDARGNSFTAWRDVTPEHNKMVDAILGSRAHVIATVRAKMAHVQEKDERTGKTTIRKLGMEPVQRDGMEYEFDVVGDLNQDNEMVVSKTRCPSLSGAIIAKPGQQVAEVLRSWLSAGEPVTTPPPAPPPTPDPEVIPYRELGEHDSEPPAPEPQILDGIRERLADQPGLAGMGASPELLKPASAGLKAQFERHMRQAEALEIDCSEFDTILSEVTQGELIKRDTRLAQYITAKQHG
jgi:hypothetical protein